MTHDGRRGGQTIKFEIERNIYFPLTPPLDSSNSHLSSNAQYEVGAWFQSLIIR